ncbi:hypothetical protein FBQ85_08405 [Cytophagia bacterium CHB2]|nr:hypothetical protein [Cytophagia bacterium CHB2]
MPITLPNGSKYELCLLDTNALSEIVKRPANEGRGYIERFPPDKYIPCFTAYNLIELRRRPNVFQKFINFFGVYPSFIAKPLQFILDAEIAAKGRAMVNDILFRAFMPMNANPTFQLVKFINDLFSEPEMADLEREWRNLDQDVLNAWQTNKRNFNPTKSVPNAQDAKKFVHDATIDTLCSIHPELVETYLSENCVDTLQSFPSMQMMLYSQYYRIFDSRWKSNDQEVTDVRISACAPYVDAVVTESFQAEIYRKAHKHINGLPTNIKVLCDIRHHV